VQTVSGRDYPASIGLNFAANGPAA